MLRALRQIFNSAPPSPALLGTGTPTSSNFLRGDGSWQPAGGGGNPGANLVKCVRTTNFAPSGWQVVTWDAEIFDDVNGHSTVTNPSRIVTPASGYTRARAVAFVGWNNITNGSRYISIELNAGGVQAGGTILAGDIRSAINEASQHADTGWIPVNPGDYFELFVNANVGGTSIVGPQAFPGRSFLSVQFSA